MMDDLLEILYSYTQEQLTCRSKKEEKALAARKCAVIEEIVLRLGEGGDDLIDRLTEVDADLEDIHDKAIFGKALRLGTKVARLAEQADIQAV